MAAIFLLLLVLAVFGRVIGHELLWWDDRSNFVLDPLLNPPTWSGVAHYWGNAGRGLYIPVTYTFWAILEYVGRAYDPATRTSVPNPYLFHAASVSLHAANVLLVFAILFRVSRQAFAAALGAAAFAVHPVQVETVAWASGTKDLLCATGVFGAILLYLKSDDFNPKQRRWWLLAATIAYTAALFSKPVAVVAPAIVLAIDLLLRRRAWRDALPIAAAWTIIAIPVAIIARLVQTDLSTPLSLGTRAVVVTDTIAFYLAKLFWPVNLAHDYGRSPAAVIESGSIYFTWLVPLAAGVVIFIFRRRWRGLLGGAAVFLIALAPVAGALPFMYQYFSTVTDHYMYLSMLGLAIAIATAPLLQHRRGGRILAVGIILIWSILSFRQAGFWQDDRTLGEHTLAVNPRSFLSLDNIAATYAEVGDYASAERYFRRSLAIHKNLSSTHGQMAIILRRLSRHDEAATHYLEIIRINDERPPHQQGDLSATRILLGQYYRSVGRYREALEQFELVLQRHDLPDARAAVEDARRMLTETPPATAPIDLQQNP